MSSVRLIADEGLRPYVSEEFELWPAPDACVVDRLRDAVIAQLQAVAGVTQQGKASVQIVSRAFVEHEQSVVVDSLRALDALLAERAQASCVVDLVLLLPHLFDRSGLPDGADQQSKDFVASVDDLLPRMTNIGRLRVWLLDGLAEDGACYSIETLADILRTFEPERLDTTLGSMAGNFLTLGARVVSFPRQRILDHLATRFSLRVLDRENRWLEPALLPFARVAHACAEFVDEDISEILAGMERDAEGKQLVPTVQQPPVVPEEPLASNMARIHDAVDDLMRKELDRIQDQLVQNHQKIRGELENALVRRVEGYLDSDDHRVLMAQAFLDMLQTSTSPLVTGDQVETGRRRTLRQAFEPAIAFFDEATEFDTNKRAELARLREDVSGQRHWLSVLQQELETAQRRAEANEDGAAPEAEALTAKIEGAEQELKGLEERLDTIGREVKAQDLEIQSQLRRRSLQHAMMTRVDEEIRKADQALNAAKTEMEKALDTLRAAEAELRDALTATIVRVVGLLLALVAVGFLGALALPALFGAVPVVGAPLFGFVGTVVGVGFLKWWGIATFLAVMGFAVQQFMRYSGLHHKVTDHENAYSAKKAAFGQASHAYWLAYLAKFQKQCDWIRYSHVFDTERELWGVIDALDTRLGTFRDALIAYRKDATEAVDSFRLSLSPTEVVVVSDKYVGEVLAKKQAIVDDVAHKFFGSHSFSRYFGAFQEGDNLSTLRADMLDDCRKDIFFEVDSMTVMKAIRTLDYNLTTAADAAACFLPIKPHVRPEQIIIAMGEDGSLLREKTATMTPAPVIIEKDDPEHVVLARVRHDIKRSDVTILA